MNFQFIFLERLRKISTGTFVWFFYHCELLWDKGSWFFKQLIFRFSCSTIFPLKVYIFLCVCCCVVPAQIVVMCHARIWVLLYYSRKLHFSVAYSSSSSSRPLPQNTFGYLLLRMYAPFLSPNLPKKELLKVIEKCLFAPSRIESLKDLSRSLGSIQQWMDPWKETSKKNMHIFSRLRTWLSIVMSHKCIEVVVALGTIFDEKKVTCG